MCKCEKALIFIDQISKVVPVFSTVTSLVDLFEKHVVLRNKDVAGNRYYEHIKKQSSWISIGVSIPILGNLGYIFYRIFIYFKNKEKAIEIEVLKEDIPDLDPIIEPIVIEEIIEPKEPRPLSETFNEFLDYEEGDGEHYNLVEYCEILDEERLNALFDVDEEIVNQQEEEINRKNIRELSTCYQILKNVYSLNLTEGNRIRGGESYVIEYSKLNNIEKFKFKLEEVREDTYQRIMESYRQEQAEKQVKKAKRKEYKNTLDNFLKVYFIVEYLEKLTQHDMDQLYQLDQLLKDPFQSLFTQSEVQEMNKRLTESRYFYDFRMLINLQNGEYEKISEYDARYLRKFMVMKDVDIVHQAQSFIEEPIEKLQDKDEKEDVEEFIKKNNERLNSYPIKLSQMKIELDNEIKELKQDWKSWFNLNKQEQDLKFKEYEEKTKNFLKGEKEQAEELLKKNWSKINEEWEEDDIIVGQNEERSSIEPVIIEMIRAERDFLNKLSKLNIFLEKLPQDERWDELKSRAESIIKHSEILERSLSNVASWKSVLEGFEPNRIKELFMALRSFEAQAHELRKTINQEWDTQEDIKNAISGFIEEIGEEESRKIGVGSTGIFSSIMGNFLMAPVQRAMRYRLTFEEFLKNAKQYEDEFPLMHAATERRLEALVLLCAMLNLLHPSNC